MFVKWGFWLQIYENWSERHLRSSWHSVWKIPGCKVCIALLTYLISIDGPWNALHFIFWAPVDKTKSLAANSQNVRPSSRHPSSSSLIRTPFTDKHLLQSIEHHITLDRVFKELSSDVQQHIISMKNNRDNGHKTNPLSKIPPSKHAKFSQNGPADGKTISTHHLPQNAKHEWIFIEMKRIMAEVDVAIRCGSRRIYFTHSFDQKSPPGGFRH